MNKKRPQGRPKNILIAIVTKNLRIIVQKMYYDTPYNRR